MTRACDFCDETEIVPEQYPRHLRQECPAVGEVGQATLDDPDASQEVVSGD